MPKRKILSRSSLRNQNDSFSDSDTSIEKSKYLKSERESQFIRRSNKKKKRSIQRTEDVSFSDVQPINDDNNLYYESNFSDQELSQSEHESFNKSKSLKEEEKFYGDTTISQSRRSKKNLVSKEDNMVTTEGEYDGFESFLKSFQLFSDEEDDKQIGKIQADMKRNGEPEEKLPQNDNDYETEGSDMDFSEESDIEDKVSDSLQIHRNIPVRWKNREVIFFDFPSTVRIAGNLEVTLISGNASIYGYNLEPKKPVTVYSQKSTGFLVIKSQQNVDMPCSLSQTYRYLRNFVCGNNYTKKQFKRDLQNKCNATTVIVMLEEMPLTPELRFLNLYHPEAMPLRIAYPKGNFVFSSSNPEDTKGLIFNAEYEKLFSDLEKYICKINKKYPDGHKGISFYIDSSSDESADNSEHAEINQISGSRIIVHGPKKAGKSVLLRYLINNFLNKYDCVFYLDTDPGQTEFAPSGTVSLTRVTKPLFGPPYTHLQEPVKMIFTGTCTAEVSPPMHVRSVKYLIEYFNENFPNNILLVNTMGWIQDIGSMILNAIRRALKPTVEIKLYSDKRPYTASNGEDGAVKFRVGFDRDPSTIKGGFRPNDVRDYSLLAYLGKCQQFFLQTTYINAMRPFCIRWDDVAVYNFNKRLPYNRYYEALNCSIVALCNVEECYMLMSTNPEYPNTLDDEPHNDCLGFGLVRAIDETQHLLYIVTPVELPTLNQVNALIGGYITVPKSILLEQPIYDEELLFLDKAAPGATEGMKAIARRSRKDMETFKRKSRKQ